MHIAVYYFKIINSYFLSEIKYFSNLLNQIICILYLRIVPNLYPVSQDCTQPVSCILGFYPTCILYPRILPNLYPAVLCILRFYPTCILGFYPTCILYPRIPRNMFPLSYNSTQPVSCILGLWPNLYPRIHPVSWSLPNLYPVSLESTCILYPSI